MLPLTASSGAERMSFHHPTWNRNVRPISSFSTATTAPVRLQCYGCCIAFCPPRVREHVRGPVFERIFMEEQEPRGLSLGPSIEAFEGWTRQHALRASNRGEGNTNTIYADLIRHITSAYQPGLDRKDTTDLESLRN